MAVLIWNIAIVAASITGVSLIGIFLLFPLFLKFSIGVDPKSAQDWRDKVLLRYQRLSATEGAFAVTGTFAWVFAWFKLRLDPMFQELPGFLREIPEIRRVLDIGCGYGVAGCALLEWLPDVMIYGIDPDAARVRVAAAVFGSRGVVMRGLAPDFESPEIPDLVDMAIVLDVIHFMTDPALELTLQRIRRRLNDGGYLVVRAIIPPEGGGSWPWKFAKLRWEITRSYARHRSIEQIGQMMAREDFEVEMTEISGGNPEMFWFIAKAGRSDAEQTAAVPAQKEHGQ